MSSLVEISVLLFPAYAGVILVLCKCRCKVPAFPRIRGGDPSIKNGQ